MDIIDDPIDRKMSKKQKKILKKWMEQDIPCVKKEGFVSKTLHSRIPEESVRMAIDFGQHGEDWTTTSTFNEKGEIIEVSVKRHNHGKSN